MVAPIYTLKAEKLWELISPFALSLSKGERFGILFHQPIHSWFDKLTTNGGT